MAQVVFIHDNGDMKVIREVPDTYWEGNILFRDDYFATKLWCAEDVEEEMKRLGYRVTPERVAEVVTHGGKWNGLNDCYDFDWECIDAEIEDCLGAPDIGEDEDE